MTTSDTSSDKKQSLGERVRLFQTMQLPGQPQNTHMGTFQLVMDLYQELLWLRKREEALVSVVDNMNADARHSIGYWVRQLDGALSIVRYTGKAEEQECDEGHSIEAWAKGWIEENGVPEVTHYEAIQATLRFVEGEVKPCGCDSESISGCWRCQMVYLANVVRELLDSKGKTTPPPPWPTTMDEVMVELGKAREKFPQWPDDIIHAAMIVQEESGELGQAALQATYEPNKSSFDNAYTEAIQTAAMAIRFMQNIAHYVPSHRKQHRDDGHEQ